MWWVLFICQGLLTEHESFFCWFKPASYLNHDLTGADCSFPLDLVGFEPTS